MSIIRQTDSVIAAMGRWSSTDYVADGVERQGSDAQGRAITSTTSWDAEGWLVQVRGPDGVWSPSLYNIRCIRLTIHVHSSREGLVYSCAIIMY